MNLRRLLASLTAVLALAAPAVAQTATPTPLPTYPLDYRTDPVLTVASYYNAIALGDTLRAYSYWENAAERETFETFAAGFADTTRVAAFMAAPVFEDFGAGNGFAQVPVMVAAEHTDGSRHMFAGCFTLHKTNVPVGNATEPDPNWYLRDSDIVEVADFDLGLLDGACALPADDLLDVYTSRNSPVEVLGAYVNAVTNRDYARAYGYWEVAPDNATLEQFAAGYADTEAVSLVVGSDVLIGGAAGSTFVSVPVLLIATDAEGDKTYFGGCYDTRRSNVPAGEATEPSPEWRLYNAYMTALDPAALQDPLALLDGACVLDAAG